jgi:hypothetical protein
MYPAGHLPYETPSQAVIGAQTPTGPLAELYKAAQFRAVVQPNEERHWFLLVQNMAFSALMVLTLHKKTSHHKNT